VSEGPICAGIKCIMGLYFTYQGLLGLHGSLLLGHLCFVEPEISTQVRAPEA
jgi:hypothetical protein